MPYEYLGESGDYQVFRGEDGQEMALDKATADQLLASQMSGNALDAYSSPAAQKTYDYSVKPSDVGTTIGQSNVFNEYANAAAKQPMEISQSPYSIQSVKPETLIEQSKAYDNAAAAAAGQVDVMNGQRAVFDQYARQAAPPTTDRSNRVRLQGAGSGQQQSAPRQVGPGLYDNGNGTLTQVTPGTKGDMQRASVRSQGPSNPGAFPDIASRANDLHEARLENSWLQQSTENERLLAQREAIQADHLRKQQERKRLEADVTRQQLDFEEKRRAFETRQSEVENMKVDMSEDTGTVILSAIAAALGAFGASLNGGPNFALDIINRAKQRRFDEQMANINNAKDGLADQKEGMRFISSSLEGRRLELQARIDKEFDSALSKLESDAQLKGLAPKFAEIRASIDQEHTNTMNQLYNQWQSETLDKYVPGSPATARTFVDPNLKNEAEVASLQGRKREATTDSRSAPFLWEGENIGVLPREDKEALQIEADRFMNGFDATEEIKWLQKNGNPANPDDQARMKTAALGAINSVKKPGQNSDKDTALIEEAVGSGSYDTLFNSGYVSADSMQRILTREFKNKARSRLGKSDFVDDYIKRAKQVEPDAAEK